MEPPELEASRSASALMDRSGSKPGGQAITSSKPSLPAMSIVELVRPAGGLAVRQPHRKATLAFCSGPFFSIMVMASAKAWQGCSTGQEALIRGMRATWAARSRRSRRMAR